MYFACESKLWPYHGENMDSNKIEGGKIIHNTEKYGKCILDINGTFRKCKYGKEVKQNTCTIIEKKMFKMEIGCAHWKTREYIE